MATTIYSDSNDGYCFISGANFSLIRDADTSGTVSHNASSNSYGVRSQWGSGRGGGTTYFIARSFFEFDVSGITHIPKEGTLGIRGAGHGNATVVAVKGTQASTLAASDFDSIDGWDGSSSDGAGGGSNVANVVQYGTSAISSWSTSTYNAFTLSKRALRDIAGSSLLKVCLIEQDSDLRDVTPTGPGGNNNYSGLRYSEYVGTGSDPYIKLIEQDNSVFFGTNF